MHKKSVQNSIASVLIDADILELINECISPRVRMQLKMRTPTDDPSELLPTILENVGEQTILQDL